MVEWLKENPEALVAFVALIQPYLFWLYKKYWKPGSVDAYSAGHVEVGYSNFGATLGLQGALRAIDRDLFVSDISLTLTRISDSSAHTLVWTAFRPPAALVNPSKDPIEVRRRDRDGRRRSSVAAKLLELEARQKAIVGEMATLRPVPRLAPAVIENRLAEWRRLLRASTTQGRTVLQRILRGRLTFTPRVNPISGEADGYDFSGPTRFDQLFTGIAVETPAWIKASTSRKGFEDTTPEDTNDGDYGRLLERAYEKSVKVLASPRGTADRWQLDLEGFSDLRAA